MDNYSLGRKGESERKWIMDRHMDNYPLVRIKCLERKISNEQVWINNPQKKIGEREVFCFFLRISSYITVCFQEAWNWTELGKKKESTDDCSFKKNEKLDF